MNITIEQVQQHLRTRLAEWKAARAKSNQRADTLAAADCNIAGIETALAHIRATVAVLNEQPTTI